MHLPNPQNLVIKGIYNGEVSPTFQHGGHDLLGGRSDCLHQSVLQLEGRRHHFYRHARRGDLGAKAPQQWMKAVDAFIVEIEGIGQLVRSDGVA
jgi:hypothetical protein